MDLTLVEGVAAAVPTGSWCFSARPRRSIRRACRARPNIHYLGLESVRASARISRRLGRRACCRSPATRRRGSSVRRRRRSIWRQASPSCPRQSVMSCAPTASQGLVQIADGPSRLSRPCRRAAEDARSAARRGRRVPDASSWDGTWRRMRASIAARRPTIGRGRDRAARPERSVHRVLLAHSSKRWRSHDLRLPRRGRRFRGLRVGRAARGDAGKTVLLVDKRPHIGGNAYDHYDEHGLLVHKYGPHIFHTNSRDVFEYLSRFTEWRPYQHRVSRQRRRPAAADSDQPGHRQPAVRHAASRRSSSRRSSSRSPSPRRVRTSEDVIVSKVGRELYEKFFRNYTRKQWGLDPSELDA